MPDDALQLHEEADDGSGTTRFTVVRGPLPVAVLNATPRGPSLRVFAGLDTLVRDQIMAMKTTFTPGHYRRRVAGVLARRLVQRLFDAPI